VRCQIGDLDQQCVELRIPEHGFALVAELLQGDVPDAITVRPDKVPAIRELAAVLVVLYDGVNVLLVLGLDVAAGADGPELGDALSPHDALVWASGKGRYL
jgi:hypothetical protein